MQTLKQADDVTPYMYIYKGENIIQAYARYWAQYGKPKGPVFVRSRKDQERPSGSAISA